MRRHRHTSPVPKNPAARRSRSRIGPATTTPTAAAVALQRTHPGRDRTNSSRLGPVHTSDSAAAADNATPAPPVASRPASTSHTRRSAASTAATSRPAGRPHRLRRLGRLRRRHHPHAVADVRANSPSVTVSPGARRRHAAANSATPGSTPTCG